MNSVLEDPLKIGLLTNELTRNGFKDIEELDSILGTTSSFRLLSQLNQHQNKIGTLLKGLSGKERMNDFNTIFSDHLQREKAYLDAILPVLENKLIAFKSTPDKKK